MTAKWDMAMDTCSLESLFNQGQVCCAGSHVFVQEGIYDKFVEEAVKQFNAVNVGDPMDPQRRWPQINEKQLEKIPEIHRDREERRNGSLRRRQEY